MVGAITNIAEEHLDYHKTMDAYIDAKALLFRMLRKKYGVKVLNADDRSYARFMQIETPWTIHCSSRRDFTQESSHTTCGLWMTDQTARPTEISGVLHGTINHERCLVTLPIAGMYNLQNALTAIACAHAVNVSLEDAVDTLKKFHGVSGRMERINAGQNFSVFIDFTVTPQAYEATLKTLRSSLQSDHRLLVLTGSCGDRMREKRPIVGKLCAENADVMVVTNEDPYTEDPERIIDDVIAGVPETTTILRGRDSVPSQSVPLRKTCVRISDRREAIAFILQEARAGDIVLFCGKGADITMMTKEGQIPWIERDIVKEELRKLPTRSHACKDPE
jgi:UDP-N-acetylmuramoyl-L-alanyl-D-glutamate--2,6-diaminopimelate ligase